MKSYLKKVFYLATSALRRNSYDENYFCKLVKQLILMNKLVKQLILMDLVKNSCFTNLFITAQEFIDCKSIFINLQMVCISPKGPDKYYIYKLEKCHL